MVRSVWLIAALLLPAGVRDARAQAVRGQLLDGATNRPIAQARLTLRGSDSGVVSSTVSDSAGRWRLPATRAGVYSVSATRLGYRPWVSQALNVSAGADLPLVLRLQPMPVALDPVSTHAAVRRNLELNGFFDRQKGNFGHFVTPEAIERRQASRVTDLLTAIPGVQLVIGGGGSVGPTHIGLRGSSVTNGALCRPRIFVDGQMYSRGDSRPVRANAATATERESVEQRVDEAISLDDLGHPSTIAGIEVYRSASQVPARFGGTSVETLCGVIVVWTQSGRP